MAKKSKTTVSKRIAYNAMIGLSFDYDNEHIPINKMNIAYLYIDSSFTSNPLPVIYLGLLVNDDLYNKLLTYRSNGRFNLDISKYIVNGNTTTGKKMIHDHFSYIMSNNASNYMKPLNDASPNKGADKYRQVLICLISTTMTNKLRKSFNTVLNDVSESTIISLAMEDTKPVIERLTTNKTYKSIMIPQVSTRYQLLKFLFDKDPFYDTNFIMFMDFERTYLLSQNGKKVSAEDGKPDSVLIRVHEITENAAFSEGMSVANDHYQLDLSPTDIKYGNVDSASKIVNNITVIDENNKVYDLDIDYSDETEGLNKKKVVVRSNNPELIKNTLESSQIRIQVVKSFIDGSIFTPNKTYNLIVNVGNENYNGSYLLESKQEIFKPTVNDFQMSVALTLRKVGKLNQATLDKSGKTTYKKQVNKAVTQTGKKTTTAALSGKANVRKQN